MRREPFRPGLTAGTFLAASLMLAVVAFPQTSAAQSGPESLVGLHLHSERDNTTDARVPGPVNFVIDTNIESADRDSISYTVSSSVTRVGGSVALRMVTRVKVSFAQVTILRGGTPPTLLAFQCKDQSPCISWSIASYFNDDPSVKPPTGGMEQQSTLVTTDPPTFDRVYGVVCTLAQCSE